MSLLRLWILGRYFRILKMRSSIKILRMCLTMSGTFGTTAIDTTSQDITFWNLWRECRRISSCFGLQLDCTLQNQEWSLVSVFQFYCQIVYLYIWSLFLDSASRFVIWFVMNHMISWSFDKQELRVLLWHVPSLLLLGRNVFEVRGI